MLWNEVLPRQAKNSLTNRNNQDSAITYYVKLLVAMYSTAHVKEHPGCVSCGVHTGIAHETSILQHACASMTTRLHLHLHTRVQYYARMFTSTIRVYCTTVDVRANREIPEATITHYWVPCSINKSPKDSTCLIVNRDSTSANPGVTIALDLYLITPFSPSPPPNFYIYIICVHARIDRYTCTHMLFNMHTNSPCLLSRYTCTCT